MIQPPTKKPIEKPEVKEPSNLRGLRILILSLAVMTVGGGMMLFVYAFSKAHQSLNEGARDACLAETLKVNTAGEILSIRSLSDNRVEVLVRHAGYVELLELDRCTSELMASQLVKPAGPLKQ